MQSAPLFCVLVMWLILSNLHVTVYICPKLMYKLSCDTRKPVFGVSDQVKHKTACASTEDGWKLEILDLRRRGIVLSTKALNSFAVTAKLICAFVFAKAKIRFSHDVAQLCISIHK